VSKEENLGLIRLASTAIVKINVEDMVNIKYHLSTQQ
jgi:hypothetical protein